MKKERFVNTNPKESISPEDIFSDAGSPLYDEISEKKLEVVVSPTRFKVFFAVVFFTLLFFAIYIFYLNNNSDLYTRMAQSNAHRTYEVGPSRGEIVTSDGIVIASDDTVFDIILNPQAFDEKRVDEFAKYISQNLSELSPDAWVEKIVEAKQQNIATLIIAKNLNDLDIKNMGNFFTEYKALSLREKSIRYYPQGQTYAHVTGYTASVTAYDLENLKGYKLSDEIGKKGIEYNFENYLRGIKGIFAKFVTSTGEIIREGLVRDIKKGYTVELTIDSRLQEASYNAMRRALDKNNLTSGAVVVLDAQSGAILALVSAPGFNPNLFVRGEADVYINSNSEPLFNRVTAGEYATGSVIKPFIAVAALEEDVIDPNKILYTKGYIEVPSIYDPRIVYRFNDWKNHGAVDMIDALAVSSNVYFYTIGGGYGEQDGLGIDSIGEYLRKFNWGKALGINFEIEGEGLVPSSGWKREVKNEPWSIGDTYNVSIGQGDILATPLQVATSMAVFANGGKLFRPFIVKNIYSQDSLVASFSSDIINEHFLSERSLDIVKKGMREAIISGSGRFLSGLPIEVAGKTGTAQTSGKANNAWFSGFGPYENPQIVVTVLLEDGVTSDNAVRVAYDIFAAFAQINQPASTSPLVGRGE